MFDYTKFIKPEEFISLDGGIPTASFFPRTYASQLWLYKTGASAAFIHIAETDGFYTLTVRYTLVNDAPDKGVLFGEFGEEAVDFAACTAEYYTVNDTQAQNYKVVRARLWLKRGENRIGVRIRGKAGGGLLIDALSVSRGELSGLREPVYDVYSFGAVGDNINDDSKPIQKAIDRCAVTGGSVLLRDGVFRASGLRLKSGVTLYVDKTAMICGQDTHEKYAHILPEKVTLQLPTYSRGCYALIYADGAEDFAITGGGVISANGECEAFRSGAEQERPVVVWCSGCRDFRITNVDIRDSGAWSVILYESERGIVDSVNIETPNHFNRDGIDPNDSSHIYITNSAIISGDDGICPKSCSGVGVSDIHVRSCAISSSANAIKLGTDSYARFVDCSFEDIVITHSMYSGISVGISDGADVYNLRFSNIRLSRCTCAISVLAGGGIRARRPGGYPKKQGCVRDIRFERIHAANLTSTFASHVDGSIVDGEVHRAERITFSDCIFECRGGYNGDIPASPREYGGQYPDYNWCDPQLPAYGMYVRYGDSVKLENCEFKSILPDSRPAVIFEDCKDSGQV